MLKTSDRSRIAAPRAPNARARWLEKYVPWARAAKAPQFRRDGITPVEVHVVRVLTPKRGVREHLVVLGNVRGEVPDGLDAVERVEEHSLAIQRPPPGLDLLPSTSRTIVVSICQISWGSSPRTPTFSLAGCTRSRGRRHPRSRTSRCQVVAHAKTRSDNPRMLRLAVRQAPRAK